MPEPNAGSAAPAGRALTDRDIEVLCAVAAGRTNRQIAELLNISEHTVHRHMTAMLRLAGEKSRTGLVSRTYHAGILVLSEEHPSWSGRRCLQSGQWAAKARPARLNWPR
ncbi:MAG TPA: helix-turn-helix transcriptional regulator [Streptosporangiaceae bacterium]